MYSAVSAFVPFWWKYGGPRELFMREEAFIGKFIASNKLKAVSREALNERMAQVAGVVVTDGRFAQLAGGIITQGMSAISETPVARSVKSAKAAALGPHLINGGIRGPHLHHKGNVYLLNERQWGNFSQTIMKNIQEKLSRAKSVNFEQLMEISEATGNIG